LRGGGDEEESDKKRQRTEAVTEFQLKTENATERLGKTVGPLSTWDTTRNGETHCTCWTKRISQTGAIEKMTSKKAHFKLATRKLESLV